MGALVFLAISWIRNKKQQNELEQARTNAGRIVEEAKKEAAAIRKEAEIQGKEQNVQAKLDFEKELRETRRELQNLEKRLVGKEEGLDKRIETIEKRESEVQRREQSLKTREKNAEDKQSEYDRLDGEAVVLGLFVLGVLLACLKRLLASLDLRLSLFDRLDSLIQTLLFANQALFQILQLSPRLAQFFLEVELRLDVLLFTLDLGLFPDRGRFFFRLFNDAPGIGARLLELVLLLLISDPRNCKENEGSDNKARDSSC